MLKNGHLSDEEIALYAEAVIAKKVDEMDESIRTHILECNECADKVLAVTEIHEDFLDSENNTPVKTIALRKSYWLQIAASIILIFGAGLIVFQIKKVNKNTIQQFADIVDSTTVSVDSTNLIQNKDKHIAQKKQDAVPKVNQPEKTPQTVHKNLLAYAEDANMEKLVDRFKNGALRGSFSIDSQSTIEIKQNQELVLEWNNKNKELLIIEFFNNSGEKLFEEETSDHNFKTKKLSTPGLYYWKLLNEDFDLLFCGKIIVQ